ncbi:MAG: MBL fold metallo-hydrolase [Verrucomicrobiales bacterium]
MLNIRRFTGGYASTNGFLLEAPEGRILIDAPEGVDRWMEEEGLEITDLLLTHQHFDHVMDVAKLQDRAVRVYSYAALTKDLTLEDQFGEAFGGAFSVEEFVVDELLGDVGGIEVAGLEFEILHIPGHSPDSICFYSRANGQLFGGDVLMRAGYGRTDFPHGDHDLLFSGIREKVFALDDDVVVYPGHGRDTTVGEERARGLIG